MTWASDAELSQARIGLWSRCWDHVQVPTVGCDSHWLCDLSLFTLGSEELFRSCPGKELPHYLRCGVKCFWRRPESLEGGHLYHQKLEQECPFLRKQPGKETVMVPPPHSRWGRAPLVRVVHPQLSWVRTGSVLLQRDVSSSQGSLCFLQRKKEVRMCLYIYEYFQASVNQREGRGRLMQWPRGWGT